MDVCAGEGGNEDVTVVACASTNHSWTLDLQKGDSISTPETLLSVSVATANQRLMLEARGCLETLTALEVPYTSFNHRTR